MTSDTTRNPEWWPTVERMTARMGYDNPTFTWEGPLFKPEHRYD